MNISQSIQKIHPTLQFDKDFIVFNNSDDKGQQLKWLNKTIKQPTKAELETAWVEIEKEEKKQEIDQETSKKILEKLGVGDWIEYVIQRLDTIIDNEIRKGTASEEMLKVATKVAKIREQGEKKKQKLK